MTVGADVYVQEPQELLSACSRFLFMLILYKPQPV